MQKDGIKDRKYQGVLYPDMPILFKRRWIIECIIISRVLQRLMSRWKYL